MIYSMTTSTHADAPRGMEFLYSLNRLNVATFRAKCLCILVGSPALFAPECKTPRQMELANADNSRWRTHRFEYDQTKERCRVPATFGASQTCFWQYAGSRTPFAFPYFASSLRKRMYSLFFF